MQMPNKAPTIVRSSGNSLMALARQILISLGLLGLIGLGACQPANKGAELGLVDAKDVHSYANPSEARVMDVALDLKSDFEAKRLSGTATLTLKTAANAKKVVLDTKDLDVTSVTDASGTPLRFSLGKTHPSLGQPLSIELPQGAQKIVITYATTDKTTALQWLDASQTAGKSHPFLLSQGQEIHTRTWIPTQDSPGLRQTYSARIETPKALKAVMSAEMLTPEGEAVADHPDRRAYRFRMREPIAPYLIAIAIGDIGFKSVGRRTGVYAETSLVEKAAYEFAEMEKLVHAAESLYGPYQWGRYDVLVLPPSFPYGGMENPRLTFLTPTILAGDRSLVSLIAHELAHSWSGNLVTNATWADFWLNEGFTVYFENRIMEQVYGKETADALKVLGHQELLATYEEISKGKDPQFTRLKPDLTGRSPDEYFSQIPYEKGAAFLWMLEKHFGRKVFDTYLKGYFQRHRFSSLTTEAFVDDLKTHLLKNNSALEDSLKIKAWIYENGLPDNMVVPQSGAFKKVDADLAAFAAGKAPAELDTKSYTTQQWQYFLNNLPNSTPESKMKALDEAYQLTEAGNSEVLFSWLQKAIVTDYKPALAATEAFLKRQGRRKYVAPLYKSLMEKNATTKALARKIYAEARPSYHEVTRSTVDKIVI
jgi:aminopeptidase N